MKDAAQTGWETKTLGKVCKFIGGGTPSKQNPAFWGGNFPWVSPKDMKSEIVSDSIDHVTESAIDQSAAKRVPEGSLLIVVRSGILARTIPIAIAGKELTINQDLKAIVPDKGLDRHFLAYFLRSAEGQLLDRVTRGATVHKLDMPVIKSLPIPLPPLEEQQRIVAVLDEAFEGLARARAHAEANLKNARELFDRAVFEIFEGLRTGHPTLALSEMAEKITKGSSPKWQGISYVDEPGVLFVTSENVGKNEIDLTKTKYVEDAFNEKDRKSILAKGDVLTNIVGASIGRTAVFELDDVANINQAVCLIRCHSKRLNNYFLSYLLNSPYFKAQLHAGEVNMARANLSLTFFRELKLPVPPVDIQEEVVQKVDALRLKPEALEKDYQSKLQDLDDLRQSLLQKAFAG